MIEKYRNKVAWFIRLIRAPLWWDSKLPLAMGIAYSIAWSMGVSTRALLYPSFLLLISGITSAIYASIFNDLLDEDEDRLAGKVTGMMQLSGRGKNVVLWLTLTSMAANAVLLLRYPAALVVYLLMWAGFTMYSLPPIRLKARGAWGVLCCALGEHFLYVLSVVLIACAAHSTPSILSITAVVVFAMAFGIRSILWHQLEDAENDRTSGVSTLGAKYDRRFLRRLGERYVFPVELLTFAVVLAVSRSPIVWCALAVYVIMEMLRVKLFGMKVIIVASEPQFRFAMLEFYQFLFPVAYLLAFTFRNHLAAYLLAAQIVLFFGPGWNFLSDLTRMLRRHMLRPLVMSLRPRKSQA